MNTFFKRALTAALVVGVGVVARAELLELESGDVLQGKVLLGQSTEDTLAFELFGTGGIIDVRWEHILEERRSELRVRGGFDEEITEEIFVPGHEILLATGQREQGVVLNPDSWQADGELQLKSARSVRNFPSAQVQAVNEVDVAALDAYSKQELYDEKLAELSPDSPALHYEMGVFCEAISDYEHAQEHLELARSDPDFLQTPDGRALEGRLRRVKILVRATGAMEMANDIRSDMRKRDWNEALEKLRALGEQYQDESIRKAINLESLERKVVRGRDDYFKKKVQLTAYSVMRKLIRDKARERKSAGVVDEGGRPGAAAGTLASAQQWSIRELPEQLWKEVGDSTGLELDEVERYWAERSIKSPKHASYGSGTFIVVKVETADRDDRRGRRRPPGANRDGDRRRRGEGGDEAKEKKLITPEEWWTQSKPSERALWLTAYFVENSGDFEIIRIDESQKTPNPVNDVDTIRKVTYR